MIPTPAAMDALPFEPEETQTRLRRPVPSRRRRILVIDDEVLITSMMQRALGAEYDVVTANDGRQGLDAIRDAVARGERFDLIFCDLQLGDIDGREVYESITAISLDLAARVVIMSGGSAAIRDRKFLLEMTEARFDKPFELPKLRAFVRARMMTHGS